MREFDNIASFIGHLALIERGLHRHIEHAVEKSAQLIESTAKDEIGHYQPAVGPFPAWPALAERTLEHHARMGVGDSPLIVTGELYASIEHETHGDEAVIGTKSEIGAAQEFGTPNIPPRPFMGPAAIRSKEGIEAIFGHALVGAIVGVSMLGALEE
jgi:HK97 gp10 family phage protein